MPKISVIIPVYNAEKYLHKCIDSLLTQIFSDFELLLIDDGSTDHSGVICDQYAAKDARVRVFHKPNGGVSSARNLGLLNALGEWISYIDSDDWIEPMMYKELYEKAVLDGSDIVYSDVNMVFDGFCEYYKTATYSTNKELMMKNYITSVWTSLVYMIVKREIYEANNLKSSTQLSYCEDFWLSVRLFFYAKKISYINKAFYNYNRINEASRVHTLNKKTEYDEQTAYVETIEFFIEQGCISQYERVMSWRILKSKQELVLDEDRHDEFMGIYPASHKYIFTCPYVNIKVKIMMWLLVNDFRLLLKVILKMRNILNR